MLYRYPFVLNRSLFVTYVYESYFVRESRKGLGWCILRSISLEGCPCVCQDVSKFNIRCTTSPFRRWFVVLNWHQTVPLFSILIRLERRFTRLFSLTSERRWNHLKHYRNSLFIMKSVKKQLLQNFIYLGFYQNLLTSLDDQLKFPNFMGSWKKKRMDVETRLMNSGHSDKEVNIVLLSLS